MQVRLVKCMIDNIVVDISFNQLGGICTYGFLERVNNELIPNHLFKMSIILVSLVLRRDRLWHPDNCSCIYLCLMLHRRMSVLHL